MSKKENIENFYDWCVNEEAPQGFLKQLQKWINIYEGKSEKTNLELNQLSNSEIKELRS